MVETLSNQARNANRPQRRGRAPVRGTGDGDSEQPRPDHVQDQEDDWDVERDDPTFAVPGMKGAAERHIDLPAAAQDRPVQYGGDREQADATYTPADEDDESQAI